MDLLQYIGNFLYSASITLRVNSFCGFLIIQLAVIPYVTVQGLLLQR